jgi:long-chain acyl-CoA synthetase
MPALEQLSDRERRVVTLFVRGVAVQEIAYETGMACSTVHNLVKRAMLTLGVRTTAELASFLGNPALEFRNLATLLRRSVWRYADRSLFGERLSSGWRWTSYREFEVLVDRLRDELASRDIRAGDRVAVISKNCLESAASAYALYSRGACYVPIAEDTEPSELHHMLADSGAKGVLLADCAVHDRVAKLRSELPKLQWIVTLRAVATEPESHGSVRRAQQFFNPPTPDTCAALFYGMQRSGYPKPIPLSHRNLAVSASGLLKRMAPAGVDRAIAHLPFSHVLGACTELNVTIASGGCAAICEDPVRLGDYIPEVRPTRLFMMPHMLERTVLSIVREMAHQPAAVQRMFWNGIKLRTKQRRGVQLDEQERLALTAAQRDIFPRVLQRFGGELRRVCVPTDGLSNDAAEFMTNLGIDVSVGYSVTELSGLTTLGLHDESTTGSLGTAIPGIQVEIDSYDMPSGGLGEIVFKGPCVTDSLEAASIFAPDGFTANTGFRSRTAGRLDTNGNLYLHRHLHDVYMLENCRFVAPLAVAEQIMRSVYVAFCAVFGAGKRHNVAVIFPDGYAVSYWAAARGLSTESPEALFACPEVLQLLEAEVESQNRSLPAHERIRQFVVESADAIDALYNPIFQIRTAAVYGRYAPLSEALYAAVESDRTGKRAWPIHLLQSGSHGTLGVNGLQRSATIDTE